MWPFALLALACVPMMGFATSMEMKSFLGEDAGDDSGTDGLNSPGGILVETLLNMNTVLALTMEEDRYKNFETALGNSEPHHVDGGLAHVQERLIGYAVQDQHYRVLTVMTPRLAARYYAKLEYKMHILRD